MKHAYVIGALLALVPCAQAFFDFDGPEHMCKPHKTHGFYANTRSIWDLDDKKESIKIAYSSELFSKDGHDFHQITLTVASWLLPQLTVEVKQTCCTKHLVISRHSQEGATQEKERLATFTLPNHACIAATAGQYDAKSGTLFIVTPLAAPVARVSYTVPIRTN